MKSAIILNVLAMICLFGIQIGDASTNKGMAAVNDVKFLVMTTIKDLDLYLMNLTSALKSHHEKFEKDTWAHIKLIRDTYLAGTKSFIVSGVKRRTDADNCVRAANGTMEYIMRITNIEKCGEPSRAFLTNVTNSTQTTMQLGYSIIDQLDEIIMDCCSPDRKKLQDCITSKLSVPESSIGKLVNDAENVMKVVDFSSSISQKRFICFRNVMENFLKQLSLVASAVKFQCGVIVP